MKVLVVGAGGVGGYYGGMLARTGADVFFIARGANLDAISRDGLTVKSFDKGDFNVRAKCGKRADSFGEADVILICVKAYDTSATLDLYRNNVGPETVILSLQNGIDNESIIAEKYGRDRVMGGIAFIGSRVDKPGTILHTAFGHITIGEFSPNAPKGRTEKVAKMFEEAGVRCKISGDIRRDLYGKMIWNVGFNALCAILDCTAKEAVSFGGTRMVVKEAMLEWINVAVADGVDLSPGMADKNIEVTLKGGEVIPSMLHDRRLGRRMEIDTFNGKVTQMGSRLGVDTPVNKTITALASFLNGRSKG